MTNHPRFLLADLALATTTQLIPQVSDVQASQRLGTKLVGISYSRTYSGGTCET